MRHRIWFSISLAAVLAFQTLQAFSADALPPPARSQFDLTLPDGRKVVVGQVWMVTGSALAVWQLNADGTPDVSFNGDGFAAIPVWGVNETATSAARQPDGKLVVAGTAWDPTCATYYCEFRTVVARLNADGTLDSTFNGGTGVLAAVFLDDGGFEVSFSEPRVSVRPDGTIVMNASPYDAGEPYLRLRSDGTVAASSVTGRLGTLHVIETTVVRPHGLWQAAPPGAEPGWGLYLAQEGNTIFASWLIYDGAGNPRWLSSQLVLAGPNRYFGTVTQTGREQRNAAGPPAITTSTAGFADLSFTDSDRARLAFADTRGNAWAIKSIVRERFAGLPVCTWGTSNDLSRASNYQGVWVLADRRLDSGGSLALTHQGDTLFVVLLDYDESGQPRWRSGVATAVGSGTFTGVLNVTRANAASSFPSTGPAMNLSEVGSFTVEFTDGSNGTLTSEIFVGAYDGTAMAIPITRRVFTVPGTACH